jgi:hypothetical protein
MFARELLNLFPRKRIQPIDGMAVTADVWQEAHDYHRLMDRFHALLFHGAGVVTGLEVIASDPADSAVYVLPGLAVDPMGQPILVHEPRAYDLGGAQGVLYLILTYNESRPRSRNGRVEEDAPLYVDSQYSLEAVSTLPPTPYVELARVVRQPGAPLVNAGNPEQPGANEIDLRFRQVIGVRSKAAVAVGVVPLRGAEATRHGEGFAHAAAAMRRAGDLVSVDPRLALGPGLERFNLLCLVGRDAFQLNAQEMTHLYNYVKQGGMVFLESCRNRLEGEPAADASFRELLNTLGIPLQPLAGGSPLLQTPYLFATPPDGYETRGAPAVQVGEGVISSTFDYGCVCCGERRGQLATRSEIRNAHEWCANLITYAAVRRRQTDRAAV